MDKAFKETASPATRPFVLQSPGVQASIVRTFGPDAFATPSRPQADGVQAQSARAKAPQTAPAATWGVSSRRRIPRGSGPHGPFKPVIVEAKDNPAYNMIAESCQLVMSLGDPDDAHSPPNNRKQRVKWFDDEEEDGSPVPSATPRSLRTRPLAEGDDTDEEEEDDGDEDDHSEAVWPDPHSPTPSKPHARKEIECVSPKIVTPFRLQRPAERPHGPRPMPTVTPAGHVGGGGSTGTVDRPGAGGTTGSLGTSMTARQDESRILGPTGRPGSGGKRSRDELGNDNTAMDGEDTARGVEANTRRKLVHSAGDDGHSESDDSDATLRASEVDMGDGGGLNGMDVDEKQ